MCTSTPSIRTEKTVLRSTVYPYGEDRTTNPLLRLGFAVQPAYLLAFFTVAEASPSIRWRMQGTVIRIELKLAEWIREGVAKARRSIFFFTQRSRMSLQFTRFTNGIIKYYHRGMKI